MVSCHVTFHMMSFLQVVMEERLGMGSIWSTFTKAISDLQKSGIQVCVCVCVCARMHVYVCVCMCIMWIVCMYVHMHACMHVCLHVVS